MKIKKTKEIQLLKNIRSIIETSRHNIVREINETIIKTYYEIGRLLIENEQKGKIRAEYSEQTINYIALQLAKEFGRGFSATNLRSMRSFYLSYKESQIWQTLSAKLSWSHYLVLLRIENPDERKFYEVESDKENWSVRELKRQQMYVNFYDREIKTAADNKTIGLILCKDKDDMIVNYTLPKNNKQIYASKYQLYLPSKKELKKQLLSSNKT
jgi:predicted nuclease of restriction endonuclease-like (RecB) superfamily